MRHHHPALLHRHALIPDRLLTFLMAFFTIVLKLCFSQILALHSHVSLAQAPYSYTYLLNRFYGVGIAEKWCTLVLV